MALNDRLLKVTLSMPGGDVVLDQTLDMHIRIHKATLAIQNRATIDVTGLTTSLRAQLLSQFTAWNKRLVETGQRRQEWINVRIEAGRSPKQPAVGPATPGVLSTIFIGQVVLCTPTAGPPSIGTRITCFTRQIDKTTFITTPAPARISFRDYVAYAAGQMGFGTNFTCDTSYNDVIITNPARSINVASALLLDIQNMYRPDIAAFVDDDFLIVKDRSKIIDTSSIAVVNSFIDTPQWTEWGVEFVCLFDQSIRLAHGATVISKMNPSLNNTYVVMELDYDLATRKTPFYVKAGANPAS